MKTKFAILCLLLIAGISTNVFSQKPIVSPRDSVKAVINGKKITINYGKPSMLGRTIFGAFVPYYKVWRTGAGEATTLITEADLEMENAIIPHGAYSLYTLPTEERWKLIINKQTGQWGTSYTSQLDLARIDLKIKKLKTPVEALTFKLEKNGNGGGTLKIEWENISLSVPFYVSKDSLVPSPRDSVNLLIDGKRIFVDYGRPSMRGRKIMGSVVPYGNVWCTGANDATGFLTTADLVMAGVTIPRGSYVLYTLPSAKHWKLIINTLPASERGKRIVNKQTGQLVTYYSEKLDFARIPLKKKLLKEPVEKFTISLERTTEKTGVMKLAWERTQLSIDFHVK
jgi:hypothetical protein